MDRLTRNIQLGTGMTTIVEDWLGILQANGHRPSMAVRAIVEVLAISTRPLPPRQVLEAVQARYPSLGSIGLQPTLEKLEAVGLLRRVSDGRGQTYYLAAGADYQPLLICQRCGEAEYVECETLQPVLEEITTRTGFAPRTLALQFFGVCGPCQNQPIDH